jgi:OOP family OmpA-OmpF porin
MVAGIVSRILLVYNGGNAFEKTNNVAQLGLVAKAPIAGNLDIYGKAAVGTQKTAMWEAGLGYAITKDLDINAGYRYLNTKLTDDNNITYKGFIAGLSYRFGGSTPVAPAPVETPAPEPAPVVETPAPHVYKDYYVDSIHFDFDVDTPMASEQAKLDNFVSVAKANPGNTFKLVGNTDAKGTDTYNNDLSKRRVTNVGNYAISHGVPAAQLQATYRGENDPVSTNDTDQGRADNRRVDIFMHK